MSSDCQASLREEYERLLLEEASGLDAGARPTDDTLRAYARTWVPGARYNPARVEEFVQFTKQRPYGYQPLLDEIMATLRDMAARISETETSRVDKDVCIAAFEFPIGPFNAEARPVPGVGFMILINKGVLALLSHVTRLIGHTTRIVDGRFEFLDDTQVGVRRLPVARVLGEVIALYLGYAVPLAGALSDLRESNAEQMDKLFRASVTFLVAHEYAHALAGHFDDPNAAELLHAGMREQEVAADWLGAKLLLAPWRYKLLNDDQGNTKLQTLLAGPLLFFAVEGIVSEAERRAEDRPPLQERLTGIAPPPVRRVMLRQYYQALFRQTFPLTELYIQWIDRIAGAVLPEIDRIRATTPRRPEPQDC